jgi:hypothetical protein
MGANDKESLSRGQARAESAETSDDCHEQTADDDQREADRRWSVCATARARTPVTDV